MRHLGLLLVALLGPAKAVCAESLSASFARAQAALAPARTVSHDEPDPASVRAQHLVEEALPSIVKICASGPRPGCGSGSIIEEDVMIITSSHVIGDFDPAATDPMNIPVIVHEPVTVEFEDGRKFQAKVLKAEASRDLALLSISASAGGQKFRPLPFGDSLTLKRGATVIIIGHPDGFDFSATKGILSHRDRGLTHLLQFDASMNGGNSGGALLDEFGRLIGITSGQWTRGGGWDGIGWAEPIEMVKEFLAEYRR